MGIESLVNIMFKGKEDTSITQLERGVVALAIQDATLAGQFVVRDESDLLEDKLKTLGEKGKKAIMLALDTGVSKVIVLSKTGSGAVSWTPDTDSVFKQLGSLAFDYLAVPGITTQDAQKVAKWAKKVNATAKHRFKVVLPNTTADNEHIINFAHDNITHLGEKYTTADFTPYVAGFIAANKPEKKSITYSIAKNVESVDFMTAEEIDAATKAGKLVFYIDRDVVRFASGVNSLTTVGEEKDDSYKQIKIVEIMDIFHNSVKKAILEKYIGRYSNTYQNKLLLVGEIYKLLQEFEREGLIEVGDSTVQLDYEAQKAYLRKTNFKSRDGRGVDTLSKEEVMRANTGENVFIKVRMLPVGAIESVNIIVGA